MFSFLQLMVLVHFLGSYCSEEINLALDLLIIEIFSN